MPDNSKTISSAAQTLQSTLKFADRCRALTVRPDQHDQKLLIGFFFFKLVT